MILFGLRCINTLATIGICAAINLYVRPQTEAIIAKYIPGEEIPSLEEMSSNIALHINHGSPFLGDGLRWIYPYIYIYMDHKLLIKNQRNALCNNMVN